VPQAIGNLISLAELELSGNPITERPNGPTSTDAERA